MSVRDIFFKYDDLSYI